MSDLRDQLDVIHAKMGNVTEGDVLLSLNMEADMTASEQASATFVIRVYCGNCGEKWEEVAPRRTEVHSGFQGVQLHPADCTKRFGCSTFIECPNCGLEEEVRTRSGS